MPTEVQEARIHSRDVFNNAQSKYREWLARGSAAVHREDEMFEAWQELSKIGRLYRSVPGHLFAVQYQFTVAFERVSQAIRQATEDGYTPAGQIWEVWDALENHWLDASRITCQPLEPLRELLAMKTEVTIPQIASMYGWCKEDGGPDTERVRLEIAKKEEDRVTPVNPAQIKHDQKWAELATTVDQSRMMRESRIAAVTKEAPEDWAELIRPQADGGQGISARQIASMKRCTIAHVLAKADELGLPRPPLDYGGARTEPVKHSSDMGFDPSVEMKLPSLDLGGSLELGDDASIDDTDVDLGGNESEDKSPGGDDEEVTDAARIEEALVYRSSGYDDAAIAKMMSMTASELKKLLKKASKASA